MPSYAEIRRQELKHIEQSLKDDRKMKREMAKLYRNSAEDIQRHIDADIMGSLLKRMSAWLKLNALSVRQMLKRSNLLLRSMWKIKTSVRKPIKNSEDLT